MRNKNNAEMIMARLVGALTARKTLANSRKPRERHLLKRTVEQLAAEPLIYDPLSAEVVDEALD
jgi:hypothetical protein